MKLPGDGNHHPGHHQHHPGTDHGTEDGPSYKTSIIGDRSEWSEEGGTEYAEQPASSSSYHY